MTVSAHWIRIALLTPALALGGCVSFGGAEPPASLLTLSSQEGGPASEAKAISSASSVTIFVPEVPAKLDVLRIPVRVNETEIAYLQDTFWVEKPARLFRSLLGETLRSRVQTLVIDSDDAPVVAGTTLRGSLREFGYDAQSSSVVVQFDAIKSSLVGEGEEQRQAFETKRFEARESGVLPEASSVGPALNRAANQIAAEVADWMSQ
jgi:cholesterol transport system auxiliary component